MKLEHKDIVKGGYYTVYSEKDRRWIFLCENPDFEELGTHMISSGKVLNLDPEWGDHISPTIACTGGININSQRWCRWATQEEIDLLNEKFEIELPEDKILPESLNNTKLKKFIDG